MNKQDTISQRSFLPAGLNLSINGTIVVAGAGTFFFNENRFRIYMNYGYRNEPSHYYGKGFEKAENLERGDSTTRFHRSYFQLYPRFVWEVRPHFYLGGLFDLNYTKVSDVNPVMEEDPYFQQFKGNTSTSVSADLSNMTLVMMWRHLRAVCCWELISNCSVNIGEALITTRSSSLNTDSLKTYFVHAVRLPGLPKARIGLGTFLYGTPDFRFSFRPSWLLYGRSTGTSRWLTESLNTVICSALRPNTKSEFLGKMRFLWHGSETGTIGETPFDWNKWKLNFGAGLRFPDATGKKTSDWT